MYQEDAYRRLRARLPIDKMRLDEELTQTPMLLQDAAEYAADAVWARDSLKHELELATSAAAKKIRESEEKAPSEQRIATMLPLMPEVIGAQTALDEAKRDAAVWSAVFESMKEKASLLRRFAEMVQSGFLTANSVYEDRKAEINAQRQAAQPKFTRRGGV